MSGAIAYGELRLVADTERELRLLMQAMIECVGAARLRFDAPTCEGRTWVVFGEIDVFVPGSGRGGAT